MMSVYKSMRMGGQYCIWIFALPVQCHYSVTNVFLYCETCVVECLKWMPLVMSMSST